MILAFGFYSSYSRVVPFTFKSGMTWGEFINSDFNPNLTDVYPELEETGKMFRLSGNTIITKLYDGTKEWFDSVVCNDMANDEIEPTDVLPTDPIRVTVYRTED